MSPAWGRLDVLVCFGSGGGGLGVLAWETSPYTSVTLERMLNPGTCWRRRVIDKVSSHSWPETIPVLPRECLHCTRQRAGSVNSWKYC